MKKVLIKGNDAVVYGALAAGLRSYFAYPITPQNEISESFAKLLPPTSGAFVQAESEIGAVNMLLGAAACGVRAMTSSSSPGISLMQETLSYMAGTELPGVIVNMARGGPGLGDIGPSQGDYFQSTRGGGHGDYRTLVLAPSTAQECHDFMALAFDLTFKYLNPVLVLGDAMVAQIKEPVLCAPAKYSAPPSAPVVEESALEWCLTGRGTRTKRLLKSVYLNNNDLARRNQLLMEKYAKMQCEVRVDAYEVDDADLVIVAYGSMGRITRAIVQDLRRQGKKVGLLRPITLYPFPTPQLQDLAAKGKRFLVLEQNSGQMVEDVRLAVQGKAEVRWHGVMPGCFPGVEDVIGPILSSL